MPIYEYKCESCGGHHEQLRRMSEADDGVSCPKCDSGDVKRQLSSFATNSGSVTPAPMTGGGCGMGACGGGGCGFNNN